MTRWSGDIYVALLSAANRGFYTGIRGYVREMRSSKKYLDIYEAVKTDIVKGRYPVGKKLPSKRVMAESQGVSVITIEHAYELLIEEGYIQPMEKSGFFVVYDDRDIYTGSSSNKVGGGNDRSGIGAKKPGVVTGKGKSGIGITMDKKAHSEVSAPDNYGKAPGFSYSIYAKTVRRVLSDYGEYLMEKSPSKGIYELRQSISDYLERNRHIDVSPEQIVIGAGAEYLYGLVVQIFGRDISYGIESPSYKKIAKVYSADGARLVMLPLGNDGIESDELWKGDMKVLHITPYRSFPSGVTASAGKKREYLNWSVRKDAFIVEDDFESEFTPSRKPEETLFSMDEEGRVIYVNTFTRTIGSYVRTAYMVLPENLMPLFEEKVGFYGCPVPTLDQLVIARLIESGDFERHINKVRRYNRKSS